MYSTRNSIQYSVMAYKEKNLEKSTYMYMWGIPGGASCKEPACQCRRRKRCRFNPWDTKIPRRRARQPTPVFLPRESHGQRSLMGYSPSDRKESDRTERLTLSLSGHQVLLPSLQGFKPSISQKTQGEWSVLPSSAVDASSLQHKEDIFRIVADLLC